MHCIMPAERLERGGQSFAVNLTRGRISNTPKTSKNRTNICRAQQGTRFASRHLTQSWAMGTEARRRKRLQADSQIQIGAANLNACLLSQQRATNQVRQRVFQQALRGTRRPQVEATDALIIQLTPCCQSVLAVMLAKAGVSVGFTYYWI
ncbi:hypothetical protein HAX54_040914 [Datura stramonium]|uniref:Uncharacterized protein n=1 Tax=Datura stramonium TaxID=4076 RepID=A0ABS8SKS5_DATST|nr:hypothetical protein [Datura stramonium]